MNTTTTGNRQSSPLPLLLVLAAASALLCAVGRATPVPPPALPAVINTWPFTNATEAGWSVFADGAGPHDPLDAVERAGNRCEVDQCDTTVGYGGSPDENGETTLDALIMDGTTMEVGSVACLRRIKPAISVARKVMEATYETLMVGELATAFAIRMGFTNETLTTPFSEELHQQWLANDCNPNFWKPPHQPPACAAKRDRKASEYRVESHDTIGVIAVNASGHVACGTSTNGARNKIPGRVGDSPIIGAGAYCDSDVGGAAATGDGDVMMRFAPAFLAVQLMRQGRTPTDACQQALQPIARKYPNNGGAMVCISSAGEYGAACFGTYQSFAFSLRNALLPETAVIRVQA